eukprot:7390639-Prymnesium_polylepis.1
MASCNRWSASRVVSHVQRGHSSQRLACANPAHRAPRASRASTKAAVRGVQKVSTARMPPHRLRQWLAWHARRLRAARAAFPTTRSSRRSCCVSASGASRQTLRRSSSAGQTTDGAPVAVGQLRGWKAQNTATTRRMEATGGCAASFASLTTTTLTS